MHPILARQLSAVTAEDGEVDLSRLLTLVSRTYEECEWPSHQPRIDAGAPALAEHGGGRVQDRIVDLIEAFPAAAALFDADHHLKLWNRRFISDCAADGRSLHAGMAFAAVAELADGGAPEDGGGPPSRAGERRSADGRWIRMEPWPTREGGILLVHMDVTETRRREALLESARDEARAADRAKSEFLANTSHELRTPLNAIIGFSRMMVKEQRGPLPAPYRDFAGDILLSGELLLGIIDDILDVARIEAGRMELHPGWVELTTLVGSVARLMAPKAESDGVRIEVASPVEPTRLFVDERKVKQALINLVTNAVKFNRPGGCVRIVTGRPAPGAAAPETAADADGLEIRVEDDGIGIAPDDIERIFEPFVQVDGAFNRQTRGAGLGLPLSRRLIELHGGRLTMVSRLGEGSVATVWLPIGGPAGGPAS